MYQNINNRRGSVSNIMERVLDKIEGKQVEVTVVDGICGKGKSSWAIQHMIDNPKDKYIYITPYLDEITRVLETCGKEGVVLSQPQVHKGRGKKINHFKEMLSKGENIVCTHALIDYWDEECDEIINRYGYTLIMDEVHNVITPYTFDEDDINLLYNSKFFTVEERGKLTWTGTYKGRLFNEFKNLCKQGALYYYGGKLYLWAFPVGLFKNMKKIYVLTWYFEAQLQSYYYRFNSIEYDMKTVEMVNGKYSLKKYDAIEAMSDAKKMLGFINVYEGNLNFDNTDKIKLTSSWYERSDTASLKTLSDNSRNFLKHIVKGVVNDSMWTCKKDKQSIVKPSGFSTGFIPLNARATNAYRHKENCVYLYNVYMNPIEKRFFMSQGIHVNEELYALTELLQWVFRSRVRMGEPINLYLPSYRMREQIYKNYLELVDKFVGGRND